MSKQSDRRSHLKRTYNLTLEQYDDLITSQAGVCAICGLPDEKRLHVDHIAGTKQVRGLLCRSCNLGLGHFDHSLDRLLGAVAYLHHRQEK